MVFNPSILILKFLFEINSYHTIKIVSVKCTWVNAKETEDKPLFDVWITIEEVSLFFHSDVRTQGFNVLKVVFDVAVRVLCDGMPDEEEEE